MTTKYFMVLFGIVWDAFLAMVTYAILITDPNGFNEFPVNLIIPTFWIIGIYILGYGIYKIVKDKLTDAYGEETYGKIIKVYPSGSTMNSQEEYMVDVLVYVPYENKIAIYNESIGFGRSTYDKGQFIKVKYYNNDINIIERVEEYDLPYDILKQINDKNEKEAYQEMEERSKFSFSQSQAGDIHLLNDENKEKDPQEQLDDFIKRYK